MKGPPLPLPTLPLPLSSIRGGPAQRVPLVLLCQETGISPPRPTPPPSRHHAHATPTELPPALPPAPSRAGGAGGAERYRSSRRAPTGPCAPGPRPRRRVAVPGGVHAAAAPRSSRSGSCRRTCPPGRGEADNGAAGGGEWRGDP